MKKSIYNVIGRDADPADSFIEENRARESLNKLHSRRYTSARLHEDVIAVLDRA